MKRALALTLTSALVALTGCDQVKKIEDDGDTGAGSLVPDAVQQRLTQSCAIAGCHVAGLTAPDLSAESGGAWVSQSGAGGPYVTFGDVDNSYLVEKMSDNPSTGNPMPLAPGELTPEDRAVIIGWVAGAQFPAGDTDGMTTGDTNATDDTTGAATTDSGTSGSETGEEDRAAAILGLTGDAAAGETLFGELGCTIDGCHGADGVSGMASPSLDMSIPGAPDEQIVDTFLNGKGGMPPQSQLEDQQLADLLAYVTETFG